MTSTQALELFRSLPDDDQVRLLTRFTWELTLVARNYYRPGTEELDDPVAVRQVNELQHQIAQHSLAIQDGRVSRYPDDAFFAIILDVADRNGLRENVHGAFNRALASIRREMPAAR